MIRIAVLDDETEYIDRICEITETAMFQLDLAYEIKSYNEVAPFLKDLQDDVYFDIYLLDVEMPHMNGLEVARSIRNRYGEPIIIYITNHVDYAMQAFEVNAYRYISKQDFEEKLLETYKVLLSKKLRTQEKVYVIKTVTSVERIPYREIYYLKKEGKYVIFVHQRGCSKVRMPLEDVMDELNSAEFLMIDRSYAANLNHVISLKQQQLTLKDGSILPVSKPRLQQVMNEILKFHDG